MNIMTKKGSLDNVTPYEHYCDSTEDLNNIPKNQITLGSVAVVLQDSNNEELQVYIANSNKEWIPLLNGNGGGGSSMVNGSIFYICGEDEYIDPSNLDENTMGIYPQLQYMYVPKIENPDPNLIYLTPGMLSEEFIIPANPGQRSAQTIYINIGGYELWKWNEEDEWVALTPIPYLTSMIQNHLFDHPEVATLTIGSETFTPADASKLRAILSNYNNGEK